MSWSVPSRILAWLLALFDSDDKHFLKHSLKNFILFLLILMGAISLNFVHDLVKLRVTTNAFLLNTILAVEYLMLVLDSLWFACSITLQVLRLIRNLWEQR